MTAFEPGREPTTLGSEWLAKTALRNLPDQSSRARVSAEDVGRDIGSATWFVIDLLRRDEGLSRRFPLALSWGADGEFCNWLCSEGIVRYGLPQGAARTIRPAAFASQPGYQVSRLIDYQGLENPLFCIARYPPNLLEGLGTWLFQHGSKHGISNQQVWWFLLESAEDPIRELVRVYLTNPAWQKHFPDAMSPPGWKRLTHWLRERYSLDATGCDYQSRSPLRPIEEFQAVYRSQGVQSKSLLEDFGSDNDAARFLGSLNLQSSSGSSEFTHWLDRVRAEVRSEKNRRRGLNVLAHFCAPIGLQASAMSTVRSLKLLDIESSCRDVPTYFSSAEQDRSTSLGLEVYNTSLIHVQPTPFFTSCYERAGLHPRRDIHRIAMWYWEYGQVPEEWRSIARDVDKIWWPTRFIGDALRKTITLPILDLMPGVDVGEVAPFHCGLRPWCSIRTYTILICLQRGEPYGSEKPARPDQSISSCLPQERQGEPCNQGCACPSISSRCSEIAGCRPASRCHTL